LLFTKEGQRVFDADDVMVLVHLNAIQCMLDLHCLRRQAICIGVPRNAAEQHVKDHGHRLSLGCCAASNGADAAAAASLDAAA
jgi:hypothetical protein